MDLKDDMAKMLLDAVRHNSQNTLYPIDLPMAVDLQASNARSRGMLGVLPQGLLPVIRKIMYSTIPLDYQKRNRTRRGMAN